MRRIIMSILVLTALCGGYFVWKKQPNLAAKILGSEFHTFKVRFGADKIVEANKSLLLKTPSSTILEPKLTYCPYVLMEVKYTKADSETREGMLLWGLCDGEMVVDVDNWTKTHGFEDCLLAKLKPGDYKILRSLAESGGTLDKAKLIQKYGDESEKWISSLTKKKLIVDNGKTLRFHLQNPRLEIEPHTRLGEWVVTLPQIPTTQVKSRYSSSQVTKLTSQAFGDDFAIRRSRQVYLPVYEIVVQHSDGSLLKTYWNGLTGKQIDEHLREI